MGIFQEILSKVERDSCSVSYRATTERKPIKERDFKIARDFGFCEARASVVRTITLEILPQIVCGENFGREIFGVVRAHLRPHYFIRVILASLNCDKRTFGIKVFAATQTFVSLTRFAHLPS